MTRGFSAHMMSIFMKKTIQFRMALFYPFLHWKRLQRLSSF